MFRALLVFAGLASIALSAHTVSAHELEFDRLSLWPDPERGTLRGQLLIDPELTRGLDDPVGYAAERRVVDYLERGLVVAADGHPLAVEFQVRELWQRGGAVSADSVMLSGRLPERMLSLTVRAPRTMKQLLVEFDAPADDGKRRVASAVVPGGGETPPFQVRQGGWGSTFASYVALGFRHVLPLGLDHVLFVVALVLGSERKWRRLLLLSLAFTLAHTLTLGLGAARIVTLSGAIVEPLIAVSIAAVALANLWPRARKHEPWVVLGFGLLHGLGFASMLEAKRLDGALLVPLLGFNVGVEAAQIVVIGLCSLALWPVPDERLYTHAVRPASLFVALVGLFWAVERVL
jgi:hypothetical protein